MTEHVFNPDLPKLGARLQQPVRSELRDVRCFKYADYKYALDNCGNDYVRYVLEQIPIYGNHERVLIDIKVHDLEPEDVPCVPGWHLDGSINPKNLPKEPEVFTLFVSGAYARTEFLAQPIVLDVEDSWNFATMSKRCSRLVPEDDPTWSIPSCQFGTYDDHHFHRGKPARSKERRLLIRTTETDIIQPKNCIYTPYKHAIHQT